jgi:dolichyl-phosphate-mannose-protein mannosyltransferase
LAGVGYLLGYDGHYHFTKIGQSYLENNVPYVGLRLFPAVCGAAIVPITFLTLKEIGFSLPGAFFGAFLVLIDNALIAQSRLILLDSMLMLFIVFSTYSWIKFYKQRHAPFQPLWWTWLTITGVGLGLTIGMTNNR